MKKNKYKHTPAEPIHREIWHFSEVFAVLMQRHKCDHTRMHTGFMQMTFWRILTNITRGQCCLIQSRALYPSATFLSSRSFHHDDFVLSFEHSTVTHNLCRSPSSLNPQTFVLMVSMDGISFSSNISSSIMLDSLFFSTLFSREFCWSCYLRTNCILGFSAWVIVIIVKPSVLQWSHVYRVSCACLFVRVSMWF